jgi:hypothetical protein
MSVKLTTHLGIGWRSRKPGSINPLPHTPSWRSAQLVKWTTLFLPRGICLMGLTKTTEAPHLVQTAFGLIFQAGTFQMCNRDRYPLDRDFQVLHSLPCSYLSNVWRMLPDAQTAYCCSFLPF